MRSSLLKHNWRNLIRYGVFFVAAFLLSNFLVSTFMIKNTLKAISDCSNIPNDSVAYALCMHKAVEVALSDHSTADVMTYISSPEAGPKTEGTCHPIGHIVGEITFHTSANLEQALRRCNNSCRSACTHGAIGAGVVHLDVIISFVLLK